MYQVLRGSNNNTSVLRSHSLLDDIYGGSYLNGCSECLYAFSVGVGKRQSEGAHLPPHLLPGTATDPPNEYVSMGGGQIIEFTAGTRYRTVPRRT